MNDHLVEVIRQVENTKNQYGSKSNFFLIYIKLCFTGAEIKAVLKIFISQNIMIWIVAKLNEFLSFITFYWLLKRKVLNLSFVYDVFSF